MKRLFCLLLGFFLILTGCGAQHTNQAPDSFSVAATTYPVYLLTQTVTEGVEGVEVSLVIDQEVSCLHNYTLTMQDMVRVEQADVLVLNGGGMEEFLEDVLANRTVVDSSLGIELICPEEEDDCHDHGHGHDDHHHEQDPHLWMDPLLAAAMLENIAKGLGALDPDNESAYLANAADAARRLEEFHGEMLELLGSNHYDLITFHDGFAYFAQSFGMHLLAAVEEEEGSEASAKTIVEITALVKEHGLPAVFTEENGSDATAKVICRECDIETYSLSMGMSGDGGGLEAYMAVIRNNIETILEAYQP